MSPSKQTSASPHESTTALAAPEDESVPWKEVVGSKRGDLVIVYERPDKGNVVYLRWTNPATGTYSKRATAITIRDANGRRVRARTDRAVRLAEEQQKALRLERHALETGAAGREEEDTPASAAAAPTEAAGSEAPRPSSRRGRVEMTLEDGIARALRVGSGVFATASEHARDTARALQRVLTVVDPKMLMGDMTTGTYRQVWRTLAGQFAEEAKLLEARRVDARRAGDLELLATLERQRPTGGLRATEMAVISLLHASKWLASEANIEVGAVSGPRDWRKEVGAD